MYSNKNRNKEHGDSNNIHIKRYNQQPETNKILIKTLSDWRVNQDNIPETYASESSIKPVSSKELSTLLTTTLNPVETLNVDGKKQLITTLSNNKRVSMTKEVYTAFYGAMLKKWYELAHILDTIYDALPMIKHESSRAVQLGINYKKYLENDIKKREAAIKEANLRPTDTIECDKIARENEQKTLEQKKYIIEQNTKWATEILQLNNISISS